MSLKKLILVLFLLAFLTLFVSADGEATLTPTTVPTATSYSDDNYICFEEGCTPFIDDDHDGFGYVKEGSMALFLDNYPEKYDCDDHSASCTTDCSNADPPSDSDGGSNKYRDLIPDCKDYCIDSDGDESCDASQDKYMSASMYSSLSSDVKQVINDLDFNLSLPPTDGFFQSEGVNDFMNLIKSSDGDDIKKLYGDCDDSNKDISPYEVEYNQCDWVDNDCDGQVDECQAPSVSPVLRGISQSQLGPYKEDSPDEEKECVYVINPPECKVLDGDGDGYNNILFGCGVDCNDCDDSDASINPGVLDCFGETNCDGIDNNCNGLVDDGADLDDDGISDLMEDPDCNSQKPIGGNLNTIDLATGCLIRASGWS